MAKLVRWLVLINPGDLINGFTETVDANCDAVYVFDFAGRILASSSDRWFPHDQVFSTCRPSKLLQKIKNLAATLPSRKTRRKSLKN
jgi:hypothetical protein